MAPHQRSHSHSPRPAVSSQSRRQDPLRLAPWPPVLVDQGAWVGVNGDGRWRATHGRTPRSEANPASRTRMWRPTVFSRQLAPLNTATVPTVCDRASDPYQKPTVGVRVRQAAAQQANRPTSRRGGCRAWLGKPHAQDRLSDGRLQGRRRRERKARRGLQQLRNVGARTRTPLPESIRLLAALRRAGTTISGQEIMIQRAPPAAGSAATTARPGRRSPPQTGSRQQRSTTSSGSWRRISSGTRSRIPGGDAVRETTPTPNQMIS